MALLLDHPYRQKRFLQLQKKCLKINYNYHDAFAPFFYTKNGTSTRSASGQPGAEYWQNRADYVLYSKIK
jgi:hypothetical protein